MLTGPFPLPVTLVSDCNGFTSPNIAGEVARLESKTAQIFMVLCREPGVSIQAFLAGNTLPSGIHKRQHTKSIIVNQAKAIYLCANIYGPATISDSVGDFASKCGLYLQDPQHCDRNVEYQNPHRISFEDDVPVYTQSMHAFQHPRLEIKEISKPFDLFRDLELEESLTESEPCSAVRTKLYTYVCFYSELHFFKSG